MPPTLPPSVQAQAYQTPMNPQMYQGPNPRRPSNFAPQTPTAYQTTPAQAYPTQTPYGYPPRPQTSVYNPNAPRPIEVYHLSEAANAAIPQDIRNQFHCDDRGHILFFTAPPLDLIRPAPKLSHSLKYLVAKEDRAKRVAEHKRKRAAESTLQSEASKKARADEETDLAKRIENLVPRAIGSLVKSVNRGTDELYSLFYEDGAENARLVDDQVRDERIEVDKENLQTSALIQERSAKSGVNLKGDAMYLGSNEGDN